MPEKLTNFSLEKFIKNIKEFIIAKFRNFNFISNFPDKMKFKKNNKREQVLSPKNDNKLNLEISENQFFYDHKKKVLIKNNKAYQVANSKKAINTKKSSKTKNNKIDFCLNDINHKQKASKNIFKRKVK